MGAIRRIRRVIADIRRPTPIHHGHVYTDHITGERFEVESVGRWVELQRLDAERRPKNKVRKGVVKDAVNNGHVEHVPRTCPECDSDTNV